MKSIGATDIYVCTTIQLKKTPLGLPDYSNASERASKYDIFLRMLLFFIINVVPKNDEQSIRNDKVFKTLELTKHFGLHYGKLTMGSDISFSRRLE